jgi:hypothetical protein
MVLSEGSGEADSDSQEIQRGIGRRFIPMVKRMSKCGLAPDHRDNGTERGRHRRQCSEACAESGAAEQGKGQQDADTHDAASQHHL